MIALEINERVNFNGGGRFYWLCKAGCGFSLLMDACTAVDIPEPLDCFPSPIDEAVQEVLAGVPDE